MTTYTVSWSIDIDGASTPEQAAWMALEYLNDEDSIAHVFEVTPEDGHTYLVDIDFDTMKVIR